MCITYNKIFCISFGGKGHAPLDRHRTKVCTPFMITVDLKVRTSLKVLSFLGHEMQRSEVILHIVNCHCGVYLHVL